MSEPEQTVPIEAKEPTETPSQAPAPEPNPSTDSEQKQSTEKPKRLTLQERLALAAQKKKKSRATESNSGALSPAPEETPPVPSENGTPDPQESLIAQLRHEITVLKAKHQKTADENKALKLEKQAGPASGDMAKKLEEKDRTISQLLEEGLALSAKEVKLQEKIRLYAARNSDLEASLRDYSEKNQDSLLKLEEVEAAIKAHKLKSVDQLLTKLLENTKKLQDTELALQTEKLQNWERKYKEVQKQHEVELGRTRDALKQVNDVNIQLDMLRNQSQLELSLKDDLISKLKQDMYAIKDENAAEVARLESKIEGLRAENENFVKSSSDSFDVTNTTGSTADSSQSIAFAEYSKLSEAHKNLQAQYLSSQENWKLIESNLLKKVDTTTSSLELLRKNKNKLYAENKRLATQVAALSDETDMLKEKLRVAENELRECQFKISLKEKEYSELEGKQDEINRLFNSDRINYDAKIQLLTEKLEQLNPTQMRTGPSHSPMANVDSFALLQSTRIRDSGLHINLDPSSRSTPRNLSVTSMSNNPDADKLHKLPSALDLPPTFYPRDLFNANSSSTSIQDDLTPYDAPDSQGDDSSSYWKASTEKSAVPTGGGGKNVQLLSRLSGNIRRLEVEILGLKEENQRLAADKDEAQRQIVANQSVLEGTEELKKKIETLEQEIEAKSEREKTLLEVIGEKSETVEELKADVVDLKDLCRQQVQQMIEMVGK